MAITQPKSNTQLVKAFARDLRIAPRKIRLVTNAVKGMYVDQALAQLRHMNKKGAPIVAKLIESAIANAKNNFSLEADNLMIKSITADMGKVLQRYFPRARGSAFVIRRKMSHVNLVLEERKRGKTANKRLALLQRFAKKEQDEEKKPNADAQDAVAKEAKDEPRKTRAPKASEQKKMNTVQNKRRLFNRKSGE